ncbi:hypothetical protein [Nocardia brasiliensis]|uniref:hypothetical protein n=1 Tax=Nocardia brasiliensis TaxID=37326 RepID=UPI00245781D4|nr:hypothetical protein [Nocardia brasiliensis]
MTTSTWCEPLPTKNAVLDAFATPVASTSADYRILGRVHELPAAHQQLCAARTDESKIRRHPDHTTAAQAAALAKNF